MSGHLVVVARLAGRAGRGRPALRGGDIVVGVGSDEVKTAGGLLPQGVEPRVRRRRSAAQGAAGRGGEGRQAAFGGPRRLSAQKPTY
ncbi:MAG: hypothetical protein MZW92_21870 [Comamonadaceae bacterium]|nr:hypothetical protein [Comamonadaceae bacterium]